MPVRTPPRKTAAPNQRRKPVPPSFQEPLIQQRDPDRPVEHNGIEIVREEIVASPLPHAAPFKYTRLIMADGGTGFACRDCLYTCDTRGEVMTHRNAEHGARYGKKRPKVLLPETGDVLDVVLPPREEGPAPETFYEMTMGELLALAPSIHAMGDTFDRLERERDEALADLAANRVDKATQHKIDVYETLREEIVDLRLIVNRQANYDALRDEVVALRNWKRKMVNRMSQLGFRLDEEE